MDGSRQAGAPDGATTRPRERVRVAAGLVSPAIERVFQPPLVHSLARRPGCYDVELGPGRNAREVLVVIRAAGRRLPLPLFFPDAESLTSQEVARIVGNVLEGMGPRFP